MTPYSCCQKVALASCHGPLKVCAGREDSIPRQIVDEPDERVLPLLLLLAVASLEPVCHGVLQILRTGVRSPDEAQECACHEGPMIADPRRRGCPGQKHVEFGGKRKGRSDEEGRPEIVDGRWVLMIIQDLWLVSARVPAHGAGTHRDELRLLHKGILEGAVESAGEDISPTVDGLEQVRQATPCVRADLGIDKEDGVQVLAVRHPERGLDEGLWRGCERRLDHVAKRHRDLDQTGMCRVFANLHRVQGVPQLARLAAHRSKLAKACLDQGQARPGPERKVVLEKGDEVENKGELRQVGPPELVDEPDQARRKVEQPLVFEVVEQDGSVDK